MDHEGFEDGPLRCRDLGDHHRHYLDRPGNRLFPLPGQQLHDQPVTLDLSRCRPGDHWSGRDLPVTASVAEQAPAVYSPGSMSVRDLTSRALAMPARTAQCHSPTD